MIRSDNLVAQMGSNSPLASLSPVVLTCLVMVSSC